MGAGDGGGGTPPHKTGQHPLIETAAAGGRSASGSLYSVGRQQLEEFAAPRPWVQFLSAVERWKIIQAAVVGIFGGVIWASIKAIWWAASFITAYTIHAAFVDTKLAEHEAQLSKNTIDIVNIRDHLNILQERADTSLNILKAIASRDHLEIIQQVSKPASK